LAGEPFGRFMTPLRITAGSLRGRRVPVPRGDIRPTSERARQAYFNIIGERVHGARFLDLFAGSGIFSFEAISRGAASATAIDLGRANTAAIDRLAQEFAVEVKTVSSDVLAGIKRVAGDVFDLVYADPPYDWERYDELLMSIDQQLSLSAGAVVAIEHRRRTTPFTAATSRLTFTRRAEYGEVWIDFFTG
jgi:16S rRNA (guanine966-N2)-methyltransferase